MAQTITDNSWKILIIDDEPEVHLLTQTILRKVRFDGRPLSFLSSYDSESARDILQKESDIAIVLMDIIMEEEDSGLKLVKYIREDLGNKLTRIILRSGVPEEEPIKRIIVDYEINDYKEKIDLTTPRLFTSIIKSLRNYRDLKRKIEINREIEISRKKLTQVIQLSSNLFASRTMEIFQVELIQMTSLMIGNHEDMWLHSSNSNKALPVAVKNRLDREWGTSYTSSAGEYFIGRLSSRFSEPIYLIVKVRADILPEDLQMLEIFFSNANIVYRNLLLKKDFQNTQSEMIGLLGDVIENRSRELSGHQERVSEYAVILARKLNLPENEIVIFRDAVKLHDTGKIGIFDSILDKPGPLSEEEYDTMKTHTTIGYDILRFSSRKLCQMAAAIAWEHHEKWDGSGYPRGLSGEDIGQLGRITCIVDVFDALSSDRVYRKAWSFEKTIQFIKDGKGNQFDPHMVDLFLEEKDRIKEILFRDTKRM